MDKRYRNLGVLLIIIVFAAAVYFLVLPGKLPGNAGPAVVGTVSFSEGAATLNSLFEEHGVPALSSLQDNAEVLFLQDSDFSQLRAGILDFKSGLSVSGYGSAFAPLSALADLCLAEIDYYAALRASNASNSSLAFSDVCGNIASLEESSASLRNLIGAAESVSSKTASLMAKYPAEASMISLKTFSVDSAALENDYATREALIGRIKDGCEVPQCTGTACDNAVGTVKILEGAVECPVGEAICNG